MNKYPVHLALWLIFWSLIYILSTFSVIFSILRLNYDDVIKWKHFPRNWPLVRGIHRSPVNSPHEGQWRVALMFSLIFTWINGWENNRETGDLRRHRAHYDVTVMCTITMMLSSAAKSLPNELLIICIVKSQACLFLCVLITSTPACECLLGICANATVAFVMRSRGIFTNSVAVSGVIY